MILMPNGLSPRKTETLTQGEIEWLGMGEQILRKLNLTLACPRCLNSGLKGGAVLKGSNDATDDRLTVTCGCRHLVFHTR